jgi:3',5'-cyclic AMP phosphodiesterase CpdA
MFVLAHISDPHIAPLPAPRCSELRSKRLGGFINWQRKRRDIHLTDTLERVVAEIKGHRPDHIAVTGDLINLSLPEEYPAGRIWLKHVGAPEHVTFVAGNHDAYVRRMEGEPARQWSEYMLGDGQHEVAFPFVRKRGPVAIVGLSTAVAAPWFRATGRLGSDQIKRTRETLAELGREGVFRIVAIHHPPESEPHRRSERLLDGAALLTAIAESGAELLIHGHEHIHSMAWFDAQGRRVPAVGVPSASAATGGHWQPAGYNLYRIDGGPGAWHCEVSSRSLAADGSWTDVGRRRLSARRGAQVAAL